MRERRITLTDGPSPDDRPGCGASRATVNEDQRENLEMVAFEFLQVSGLSSSLPLLFEKPLIPLVRSVRKSAIRDPPRSAEERHLSTVRMKWDYGIGALLALDIEITPRYRSPRVFLYRGMTMEREDRSDSN
ncbi:hypothetical protein HZH66_001607 [Vespula vulgaris]|uniref:Uncharacterized protein n=1 Tax=Vespula vulgaris TaxID=7454 RepID=A0A834KYY7_VESVU|nr:hypothetical protein HZH66_001607 [Vespula vulgaris]